MAALSIRPMGFDRALLWLLAAPAWILLYVSLMPLADLVFGLTPLVRDTRLGEAV
ncbi:hypothetical protein [Belnapia rosea]|uniref:hypothetical protein n=1 Tax=Belnapia rosea TaxID=938405 RepID=UPI0008810A9D|nr:hypothetical protein [Belnapia rosea]SDB74684.1 hypothetical protein SAMN02927895_05386 [Belnapia rosea]